MINVRPELWKVHLNVSEIPLKTISIWDIVWCA
jgi:hypothetical protein